jgi:hypothetical protein
VNRAFHVLILAALYAACGSSGGDGPGKSEPSLAAVAFQSLADSIGLDTLPYVLNEADYVRYSDFKPIADTLAAKLSGSAEAGARYFIVGKPIVADSFTALVILESRTDTTFTAQEHFALITYDSEGKIVGRCTLGEYRYDENFYKSVGSISVSLPNQWLVIVETFMSELVDGEWKQISFPIEVTQYAVDAHGAIRHVKTTTNSLEAKRVDVS